MYRILKTPEYEAWLAREPLKSQVQIEKRVSNIESGGHFGNAKALRNDIWELKWHSGRRVYYAYMASTKILLLIGGNKNGQGYTIAQAEKIFKKYV